MLQFTGGVSVWCLIGIAPPGKDFTMESRRTKVDLAKSPSALFVSATTANETFRVALASITLRLIRAIKVSISERNKNAELLARVVQLPS